MGDVRSTRVCATCGVVTALLAGLSMPAVSSASDTLFVNGRIYTGNPAAPWGQAIAVTGSRIDDVGTHQQLLRHHQPQTRVIDLEGRTVVPGIVDSHTHLWLGALALQGFNLALPDRWIEPREEQAFISALKAYASGHPKAPVLFGRAPFGDDVSHALLDRAVPDRPVVIHAPTEHTLWVNREMLRRAGITNRPVPEAALEKFIVRDASGRPTGVVKEAAMPLIERALVPMALEDRAAWLRDAAQYLNRYGITSVTNATGGLGELQAYARLRDRGELTVRTKTGFGAVAVNHRLTPQFLAELEAARTTYNDRWVSAGLVKIFADGAGGPPLYVPEEYRALVLELDRRGFQVMTHTLSAATARMALDTYEVAIKANGPRDRRFRIEHGITVAAQDVLRLAPLGVVASMQPDFCCFPDGPNAAATNVWKTLRSSGATVAFGSDWPCTFPPDPFGGIQQAVTRAARQLFARPDPTSTPRFVSPSERLTVEEALAAYTKGGAYARFSEDYTGTLEAGKEADLVVLSQDLFTVRPEAIGSTQAVLTMVGGRIVFNQMR